VREVCGSQQDSRRSRGSEKGVPGDGVMAGLASARRAAKLDPLVALRNE